MIGAIITGFIAFLKWWWRRSDPGSRGVRHKDLLNMNEELHTAITKKHTTDEKIVQMESHLQFLDRRVDRMGPDGEIPIT